MDNAAIARLLFEIGDLLEIRGDNPFKIRAYRNAAETVTAEPTAVAALDDAALRALPGIGRDLAARIREIADTGDTPFRHELLADFPATILDLLRLQGVGPKTVKRLYDELGVTSLDTLEQAARDGRVRGLKGMGAKKEALILRAIEERRRYAGRHLSADVARVADSRHWRAAPCGAGRRLRGRWAASGAAPRRVATSTSSRSGRPRPSCRRSRRCRR